MIRWIWEWTLSKCNIGEGAALRNCLTRLDLTSMGEEQGHRRGSVSASEQARQDLAGGRAYQQSQLANAGSVSLPCSSGVLLYSTPNIIFVLFQRLNQSPIPGESNHSQGSQKSSGRQTPRRDRSILLDGSPGQGRSDNDEAISGIPGAGKGKSKKKKNERIRDGPVSSRNTCRR